MHVLLQRGDPLLLLGAPAANIDSLPAAAGGAGDAGHHMGPREASDVTKCRLKRFPEPEVQRRRISTHSVGSLRDNLPESGVLL
eukprot:14525186-Heterocapsa_arctica.AAC.1